VAAKIVETKIVKMKEQDK